MGMRESEVHDQTRKDLQSCRKEKVTLKRMLRLHMAYIENLEAALQDIYDETVRPEVEATAQGKVANIQMIALQTQCVKELPYNVNQRALEFDLGDEASHD